MAEETLPLKASITSASTLLMFLLGVVALSGLTACEHPPSNVTVEDKGADPNATAPTVSLPEPPAAEEFIIKEKNDDGTLRVQGLIENKANYMDKEVVVTGKVVKLSPECDPAKAKKENEKCPDLHMIIQDDEEDAEKQILVVGYRPDFLKRSKLKEGEVHQFKAMYKMMGWGFTASEDGLLELIAMDDIDVIEQKK
mgnify:CR=1 FL=1